MDKLKALRTMGDAIRGLESLDGSNSGYAHEVAKKLRSVNRFIECSIPELPGKRNVAQNAVLSTEYVSSNIPVERIQVETFEASYASELGAAIHQFIAANLRKRNCTFVDLQYKVLGTVSEGNVYHYAMLTYLLPE